MISLVAFITAKPGHRPDVLAAMAGILTEVRGEDGCIEYRPTIDIDRSSRVQTPAGPDTIVVVEKWRDREALRAHMNAPHMVSYAALTRDLIADRKVYFLVDAFDAP